MGHDHRCLLQILGDEKKRQQYDQFGKVDDLQQPRGQGRGGPVFDFGNGFRFTFDDFFNEGGGGYQQPPSMRIRITARFVESLLDLQNHCQVWRITARFGESLLDLFDLIMTMGAVCLLFVSTTVQNAFSALFLHRSDCCWWGHFFIAISLPI